MFKYLACPNEAACEGKNLYPNYDGTRLVRQVDKYNNYVLNDICSYIVYSPPEMKERDRLLVLIDRIENADVYVVKGRGYKWINHLDRVA
jgi:hypothetical protein